MAKDKNAPSKVEKAKTAGKLLRGTIDEVLNDSSQDKFEHDDLQLLKFHGTYQQDDRDLRAERRKEGLGKAFSFMIRIALPGGVVPIRSISISTEWLMSSPTDRSESRLAKRFSFTASSKASFAKR